VSLFILSFVSVYNILFMKFLLPVIVLISVLSSCSIVSNNTPVAKNPPTESRSVATPTYGTGKTQVTIFADFQCPACIASNDSLFPILEGYAASGRLTITYRQYPLSMHKNAKGDAIAALCSAE
jgi:protein-disulfide isomerase